REAPVARETAGPGYVLPDDLRAPAGAVRITRENAGLLEPHFADWFAHQDDPLHYLDSRSPVVASVEDDVAASLRMCARLASPGIEAGLETAEPYRRRGHAVRAVAGWAQAVREAGSVALYSTDWSNVASQAVAARLGARRYGADFSLR